MLRTIFTYYLTSSLLIGATADPNSCVDAYDAFLIQDTSETFRDLESAVTLMMTWIDAIQAKFANSRFGYGTFTDKAVPLSGFGPYGGWPMAGIQYDWCFELEQSLVESKSEFEASLRRVGTGSGYDWLESQFEAMLRGAASHAVGWNSEDKRIRSILMITDVASHLPGDAASNIAQYNAPMTLASAAKMESAGGWGSHALADTDLINYYEKDRYLKMASLLTRKQWHPSGITSDQEEELQSLMADFGPAHWPEVVPHPGDDSLPCEAVDYPSGEQVTAALKARDIIPIVLVIGASESSEHCTFNGNLKSLQNCPLMFYKQWMSDTGIDGIVRSFPEDLAEAVETLISATEDAAAIVCPTTSPEPTTIETTTTTTTTTTEPTTTTTTTTTTTEEPTTTTTTTTTEPTTTTTTTTTEPTTTTTTTTTEPTTTTTTTTTEPTTTTTTTKEPTTTTTTTTTTEPTTTTTTTTTEEPTTTTTTTTTEEPTTTTTTTTTEEPTTTTTTTTTTTEEPTTTTTTTTTTTEEPTTTTTTTTTTTEEPTTTTSTTTTTSEEPTTTTREPTTTTSSTTTTTSKPTTTEEPTTTTTTTTSKPTTTEVPTTTTTTSTTSSESTTPTPTTTEAATTPSSTSKLSTTPEVVVSTFESLAISSTPLSSTEANIEIPSLLISQSVQDQLSSHSTSERRSSSQPELSAAGSTQMSMYSFSELTVGATNGPTNGIGATGVEDEETSAEAFETTSTNTEAPGVFPAVALGTAAAGAAALGATAIYAGTNTSVFGSAFGGSAGTVAVENTTGLMEEATREAAQVVQPDMFA